MSLVYNENRFRNRTKFCSNSIDIKTLPESLLLSETVEKG